MSVIPAYIIVSGEARILCELTIASGSAQFGGLGGARMM